MCFEESWKYTECMKSGSRTVRPETDKTGNVSHVSWKFQAMQFTAKTEMSAMFYSPCGPATDIVMFPTSCRGRCVAFDIPCSVLSIKIRALLVRNAMISRERRYYHEDLPSGPRRPWQVYQNLATLRIVLFQIWKGTCKNGTLWGRLFLKQKTEQQEFSTENYSSRSRIEGRRREMRLITHLSPGLKNAVKFVVFHILVDNILVWSRAKWKRAAFSADLNRGISAPMQSMADNNGRNTILI